mmetsp:Transcript_65536/g.207261  ORF Transcript_65536/g.207261 Transcript_65536/m.207261 type:complete len:240 (-) Transcript_65536:704-1423(-)
MEPYHLLPLALERDELCEARVVLTVGDPLVLRVVGLPLERLEIGDVHFQIVFAILCRSILLRQPHAAILKGREHCRGHLVIIDVARAPRVEATRQQFPRLDGHGGQLLAVLQHVPDGIDVLNICLLEGSGDLSGVGAVFHARCLQAKVLGQRVAPHSHQDGVIGAIHLHTEVQVLVRHLDLAIDLLELDGHGLADHLSAMALHVLTNVLGHLLIEPAEEYRPAHHRGVVPHGRQEARAL